LDAHGAKWAPGCLSDGVGNARSVGPDLKDGSGHAITLTPSATAGFLVLTYLEVGVSSEMAITEANLLAVGVQLLQWVPLALATPGVSSASAALVGGFIGSSPDGLAAQATAWLFGVAIPQAVGASLEQLAALAMMLAAAAGCGDHHNLLRVAASAACSVAAGAPPHVSVSYLSAEAIAATRLALLAGVTWLASCLEDGSVLTAPS
jgi:hypothetical protein